MLAKILAHLSFVALACHLFFSSELLYSLEKTEIEYNLNHIKHSFEVKYAPAEWKKKYVNWDLHQQIELITLELNNLQCLSTNEFQKSLHAFFISTADFHVQDVYYATEKSSLPFAVSEAQGRYFVTFVNKLDPMPLTIRGDDCPTTVLQYGDELILFNGREPSLAINELQLREVGNLSSKASRSIATDMLTIAFASFGQHVPKGQVSLQFKLTTGQIAETTLDWHYEPEKIAAKAIPKLPVETLYGKKMESPLMSALQKRKKMRVNSKPDDQTSEDERKSEHALPCHREDIVFGNVLWEDEHPSPFRAYLYQLPFSEEKIAYIRLDSYAPADDIEILNIYAKDLATLLHFFEQESDALVIDQVDNSGGYALYLYAIASMLTDRPLELPVHRRTITQEEIYDAYYTIQNVESGFGCYFYGFTPFICGYPNDNEFQLALLAESYFLINEWNNGVTMTAPYPLFGIERIKPHRKANYTKPIVVLINNLDFSGGDFLPAILKDNKRAILFGEQTAGAGGIVEAHGYPNKAGLAYYTYTASFATRSNGTPIENIGVTPDVFYEVSSEDLLNGYCHYIDAVNMTVKKVLTRLAA